jgi:lipopolysaccharide transport system permease protein
MTISTNPQFAVDATIDVTSSQSCPEQLDEVVFHDISQMQMAWQDIKQGVQKWRIWFMLAYQDIKLRYRRSILGPFWITLSMAITVYSMGFLYSKLFHVELKNYFPFLVAGMLSWQLIASILIELTDGISNADGLIKQIKLPYTLYMHRIATRNMLIFLHNLIVMVPIIIVFHESTKINFSTFLLIPGMAVIYFNTITYGLVIGMIGARYRDVSQIIKSLIQVVFFVTPVLWAPSALSTHSHLFVDLNPFYALIELIRAPLLGNMPTLTNVIAASLVTLFGLLLCAKIFTRYRSRIVYWL